MIRTVKAPTPVASYSQAIRNREMLLLAGQGAFDVNTGQRVSDDIEEQTRQTLQNLQHVLEAASATWDDVVSVRVFVTEHAEFAGMDKVYGEFFRQPYPTRTKVFCRLAPGMRVEIDAAAIIEDADR